MPLVAQWVDPCYPLSDNNHTEHAARVLEQKKAMGNLYEAKYKAIAESRVDPVSFVVLFVNLKQKCFLLAVLKSVPPNHHWVTA